MAENGASGHDKARSSDQIAIAICTPTHKKICTPTHKKTPLPVRKRRF
jgi:hypothetical protein